MRLTSEEKRPPDFVEEMLDDIDKMSIAELEEEIRSEGKNPDDEAEDIRQRLLATIDQFQTKA